MAGITSNASTAATTNDARPGLNIGTGLTDTPKLYVNGVLMASTYDAVAGTLTPTVPLAHGATYALAYTLTDATGNESLPSSTFNLTIDTLSPTSLLVSSTALLLESPNVTNVEEYIPQITPVGSNGEYVITWYGPDAGGDYSIFVQKFNADGTTAGNAPVQLEAIGNDTAGDQESDVASVGTVGGFVVTWRGIDSVGEGGDDSVFVQQFNADGQPIIYAASTDVGTAYLVNNTISVTDVLSITNAADALWNQVSLSAANARTSISYAGLTAGSYHLYTIDVNGNLSAQSAALFNV